LKALTIRQPWAQLIIYGIKDVENRSWQTKYRGPLLIHAGLTVDREDERYYRELCQEEDLPWPTPVPTGCIVGIVQLVDCVTESDSEWFYGPFGWVLEKALQFETPIPFTGRLGLYEVPDELIAPFRQEIEDIWVHWDDPITADDE